MVKQEWESCVVEEDQKEKKEKGKEIVAQGMDRIVC